MAAEVSQLRKQHVAATDFAHTFRPAEPAAVCDAQDCVESDDDHRRTIVIAAVDGANAPLQSEQAASRRSMREGNLAASLDVQLRWAEPEPVLHTQLPALVWPSPCGPNGSSRIPLKTAANRRKAMDVAHTDPRLEQPQED